MHFGPKSRRRWADFAPGGYRSSKTAGFTLLEIVISITILVVILAIIYETFNSSMEAYTAVTSRGDAYGQARLMLSRMSEEIGSIYFSGDNPNTGLLGEDKDEDDLPSDSLHFTTLSHVRWVKDSRESELCEVGYYLEADREAEKSFLLRREDWNVDGTFEEGGIPLEVAEAVEGLNFRYYDGEEWVDDWDSKERNGLPKAIEVVLLMKDPSQSRIIFSTIIPIPLARK